jgi:vacuolar-type H+-ATPase subunit I/STV1
MAKSKGLGTTLKGFFFEEAAPVAPPSDAKQPGAPTVSPVASSGAPAIGEEDLKIAETLSKAVAAANIEGFDYFEFAQLITSLKPSLPSEQTLFQTAYTSGKVMGASKAKLVESAKHYLKVLDAERKKFEDMVASQTQQSVTGLEKEMGDIDEQTAQAAEQIRQLTDKVNGLSEKKTQITNQIAENKARIEKVQNNFQATLGKHVVRIQTDMEKIEKYIKEETANA